jgi:Zn-dependent alcohol dehydrogenase
VPHQEELGCALQYFTKLANPWVLEEVELEAPHAAEVLVRIAAAGICHSDYHVIDRGVLVMAS